MPTYCLSDLHLHDEDQPYLFTGMKQLVLTRLCDEVMARNAHLVLAGDVFDLTGMNPPPSGLDTFFATLLPAAVAHGPGVRELMVVRSVSERIAAVGRRFPHLFAALAPIAKAGRLHVIPGNHDYDVGQPEGRAALAAALGGSGAQIDFTDRYVVPGYVVAQHGQQFDDSNRTDGGVGSHNRGSVITGSLYRGVMPALTLLGLPSDVVAAIPAVRPEENIVDGIERWLGGMTSDFLIAFVKLLEENDYFEGLGNKLAAWLGTSLHLVTAARVRQALADDNDLAERVRAACGGLLAEAPGARVVVLGHTHVFECAPGYVNLGTWIDHVTGLTQPELDAADRTLPVLCIEDDQTATARDARGLESGGALSSCKRLATITPAK